MADKCEKCGEVHYAGSDEVACLRKELSQAKADLAREREGKCDWHLPSCHVFAQEQKARAERAEAALKSLKDGFAVQLETSEKLLKMLRKSEALAKEQERVIRAEVWEEAANIAEKQALRGLLVYAGDFRAKAKALRALTPDPAKEER